MELKRSVALSVVDDVTSETKGLALLAHQNFPLPRKLLHSPPPWQHPTWELVLKLQTSRTMRGLQLSSQVVVPVSRKI